MLDFYPLLYRAFLGRLDAERAHRLGLRLLAAAERSDGLLAALRRALGATEDPRLHVDLWGLRFANPLGMAAGFDKDAQVVRALSALGFGHVEVGTVTPQPQPGNPRPRLWRVEEQRAVINRLGFPSSGMEVVARRLSRARASLRSATVVGVNIGKNAVTPLERATDDYVRLAERFAGLADYYVVNVSSPNTVGLRRLQAEDQLVSLMRSVVSAAKRGAAGQGRPTPPVLVKLSPDLEDDELARLARAARDAGAGGLVATNTTTARAGLAPRHRQLPGGLSGHPLFERARAVIRQLYRAIDGALPIIGVGGVASAEHALAHIRAGASLVQSYTAFIYGGPSFARQLCRGMLADADRRGWTSVAQLVGSEA